MSGVSGKPLSRVGKETCLKPVIQAIPTYVMSCFMLPVSTCDDMRRSLANQWWGVENGKKISIGVLGSGSLHTNIWGGMGFREFKLFNQAMLGRQCWRLLTEPNSLCARVLKARYFPDYDFWEAPSPRSASYTWRSILFGKKLLEDGIVWVIGDGKRTKILTDNWIPGCPPYMIRLRRDANIRLIRRLILSWLLILEAGTMTLFMLSLRRQRLGRFY